MAVTAPAVRADNATFSSVKAKYTSAMSDFDGRLSTVEQFEISGGLGPWTTSAVKLGNNYLAAANALDSQIRIEVAALANTPGWTRCTIDQADLDGPYGSHFGLVELDSTYLSVLNILVKTRSQLEKDQDSLSNRLANLVASGHTDLTLYDKLRAIQNTRTAIEPIYQTLLARSNSLNGQLTAFKGEINGPDCRGASPSPSPAPKPPAAASAHGCIGFNGYWANQVYGNNYLHIAGNSATLNTTTFTGTVNGKVMSGTFTNAKGDKGTFTFTLAYTDLDYIDVATKIGNSSQGLLTFHCVRGQ